MPQLSLSQLFGAYKREKSRRGGEVSIQSGWNWIDDASAESRWMVWSSKMTAPSPKQALLLFVSEAFVTMGTTLLVFAFYLKKNHQRQTKT